MATKSKPIADLEALGARLAKDGYPTARIDLAVTRMIAMEKLIVDNITELNYLRYVIEAVDAPLGPASDDVFEIIKQDYDGEIPEGY